jgi:23S rRNA (uridine2552-2'-O)-methyltransferase
LGCYPGSWSQYGIRKVGPKGELVGIDLTFPDRLSYPNFRFIQGDVLTIQIEWLARKISPRDLVMSDLAPQTTGIPLTDASRSMVLSKRAAEVARALLKEKGHFVCKVFEGEDMVNFRSEISEFFRNVRAIRPKATRKGSKEIYLVGLELVKRRK